MWSNANHDGGIARGPYFARARICEQSPEAK
jgi:hypothetical protein